MRISRATTAERPVFNAGKVRLRTAVSRLTQRTRQAPWLYIGASAGFIAFGFDTWRPLGFLVTGVMFTVAEIGSRN